MTEPDDRDEPARLSNGEAPTERHVVFTVDGRLLAFPAARLLELAEVPTWTPLPRVPPWIRGLANLHGDIVAVADPSPLWARPPIDPGTPSVLTRLLLVGPPGGHAVAGVVAEHVWGVVAVPGSALRPDPGPSAVPHAVASFDHDGGVAQVLDLDRLLADLSVGRAAPKATPPPALHRRED